MNFWKKISGIRINTRLVIQVVLIMFLIMSLLCYYVYSITKEIILQNAFSQTTQIIEQTAQRLEDKLAFTLEQLGYIEIDAKFQTISAGRESTGYIEDLVYLSDKFEQMRNQNRHIVQDIYFYRMDGAQYYEYRKTVRNFDRSQTDWFLKAAQNGYRVTWYPTEKADMFLNKDNNVIRLIKPVSNKSLEVLGLLVFDLKESFFENELKNIRTNEESLFFVYDEAGNVISSCASREEDYDYQSIISLCESNGGQQGYEQVNYGGDDVLLIHDKIEVNGWCLVGMIPVVSLAKDVQVVGSSTVIAFFVSLFMGMLLLFFMIRNVTRPIKQLTKTVHAVELGNMDERYRPKKADSENEIDKLGMNFNSMLDSIQTLIIEVEKERTQKAEAELRVLQQQINSHFLYNTLDTIYWKIKKNENQDACQMTICLATFIRLSLNRGENLTTLEKELEHVKMYISIEKLRYGDRVNFGISVDDNLNRYEVPKLILQPIVENSLMHGIFEKKSAGNILLRCTDASDKIQIEIIDDGVGVDMENINEYIRADAPDAGKGDSLALKNIYARLKMMYGDNFSMEIFSEKDVGTKVSLLIPKQVG